MNSVAKRASAAPIVERLLASLKPVLDVVVAMIIGFGIGAIMLWLWGYDPLRAYAALLRGSFGSYRFIGETLAAATPLILTGLTFAIGLRIGLFNIGAQGQLYMGGIGVLLVANLELPYYVHIPLAMLLAMAGGALWAVVPALLKITRGVHEVISTIMFNWIGRWLTPFLLTMYFLDPLNPFRSVSVPKSMWFYNFIPLSDFSAAIFVSVAVAVVIYFFLWFSPLGFELRMSGLNFDATRYSGVNPQRSVFLAFILGGITAGLAGGLKIMTNASSRAIDLGLTGYGTLGFDGIATALIGRNHPLGVIVGGIIFGALAVGAREMQRASGGGVPLDMIRVVQGIIIVVMAVPELHRLFTAWRAKRVQA